MKNMKIATKVTLSTLLVMFLGFFCLWAQVSNTSEKTVGGMIEGQMKDAVHTRGYIINNYVQSAEEYLVAFGQSDEVKNLLKDPSSPDFTRRAQQYTVDFANVKGVFEGLYIATPETLVLTHTTESVVGITTRKDEGLKQLQEEILSKQQLSNTGILKSPTTGNMCISMYYPIYDGNRCIGFVGAAVLANELMDSLLSLEVQGLPDSQYVFINAKTGEYLYHENEEMLCTVTEDAGYLAIIDMVKEEGAEENGLYSYVDENGVEQVVVYQYLPERDWVFAIRDTHANVYNSLDRIKNVTSINCVIVTVAVIVLLLIILSGLSKKLGLISKAITMLGNMNLSADQYLAKYSKKRDEVGIVCNALQVTCTNLRTYIDEVDRILSDMANGDLRDSGSIVFEGDFKKLQESLIKIQHALRESFTEIGCVTKELSVGSQSVSSASAQLASSASSASNLVLEIDNSIIEITKQLAESAEFAEQAKQESANASELVTISKAKMEELCQALADINHAANAIEGISGQIEGIAKQTNILALNAMVEASKAGDAGLGFGVVADEIRILATQSNDASVNAYYLIQETQKSVETGIRIGEETSEYLAQVVTQTATIDSEVTKIAETTMSQNEKVSQISKRLEGISKTVEQTAAMAEQSAAASEELDGQAIVLRDNISHYQV
ncbi:MAG: methyl-accepting chemotaxis protein [Agathobacter sp.]|nr:methyl-accepting chemotaxis protein [Agathobacter sp.]